MRGVLWLFGLTGCQLVFPVSDDGGVDSTVDLSNPTVTTAVKSQAIASEGNQLIVTVVGTPNTRVAYAILIDQGVPARVDNQQLDLDGDGMGSAVHAWTPGMLGHAGIDSRGDYDLTLASPGATHADAAVFERFGDTNGDLDTLNQLDAGQLVAVPILLPVGARIERLAIHVSASTPTMGILGLYEGVAAPTTLVADTGVFSIDPSEPIVVEVPTQPPAAIDPQLNYWVAFVADKPIDLPQRARTPPPIPLVNVGSLALPDPLVVTPTNLFPNPVAVGATLGPSN